MIRAGLLSLPRGLCGVWRLQSTLQGQARAVSTGRKLKTISNLRRWGKACVTNCVACVGYDAPDLAVSSLKMTPGDVACAVKYVTHGTYERLGSYVLGGWRGDPWAGYTQIRGWQRMHNEQFSSAMAPLLADSSLQRLLMLVEDNIEGFTPKEAVETLLSLLLIGCHTSPVIHKLLSYSKRNVGGMDVKCLMLLARISDMFPRDDFMLLRMVLSRYEELLVHHMIPRNDETVNALCVFTKMLYKFISPSLLSRFYTHLLQVVTDDMPIHLYSTETLVNVCLVSLNGTASTQKQIVNVIKKMLPDRIAEFKPFHLMKLSTAMQSQSLYDDSTRKLIDAQIDELLKEDGDSFGLRETMILFRTLTGRTDRKLIHRVESLVEKKLKKDHLDDRLTVQLARSLYKVDSSNVDLVGRVQAKVAEYPISVNLQISAFVTLKEFINTKHKEAFVDRLMSFIEGGEPYFSGEPLRLRCVYVLALMVPLTEDCSQKLLGLIQGWKFEELSLFLYGLMKWPYQEYLVDRRRRNEEKHVHQISGIFETVMENLIAKLDTSKTLAFFMAILSTSSMKWTEKGYYMHVLMERFHDDAAHVIANSNRRSLCHVLKFCTTARYFDAALCDTLSDAVVRDGESAAELRYSTLHYLFAYLGICGYRPDNVAKLVPHARWFLDELYKSNSLSQYLRTIANLTAISSVPVDLLASVFTTDFLAKLNRYLKDNPEQQKNSYEHLVFLNQSAVLEYPQLGVPWFLGDIVEKIGKAPSQSVHHWDNALRQVVGGAQFYRKFAASPIGHHIDFELVTDRANHNVLEWEAISLDSGSSGSGGSDAQQQQQQEQQQQQQQRRVAILIEPDRHFCMVRKGERARRLGRRQKAAGHLHKLGYTVVQVPGQEWPRKKADYEAYLRQKLALANVSVKEGAKCPSYVKASSFR